VAEPLRLVVWTPSETLVDVDQVEWVHVELAGSGGLTIWPGHAPLVAESSADVMRYADRTGTQAVDLAAGVLQVEGHTVTVFLAGQAWPSAETERFERLSVALRQSLAQGDADE
jgi:F0F1-type ATP synthase epsilon subunit